MSFPGAWFERGEVVLVKSRVGIVLESHGSEPSEEEKRNNVLSSYMTMSGASGVPTFAKNRFTVLVGTEKRLCWDLELDRL